MKSWPTPAPPSPPAPPPQIRRPRRGLGVWGAGRRGTLGRELVGGALFRSSGRGGRRGRNRHLRHQSVSWALPESVHFAAARTCGRVLRESWESQSSPGDRQGRSWGPRAIPGRESGGHFGTPGDSRGASRVHFRVFGARFSFRRTAWEAKVRSSNSPKCSIGANPAKLCSKFFFRGRRLWPQAISYVQLFEISTSSSCEKESLRK